MKIKNALRIAFFIILVASFFNTTDVLAKKSKKSQKAKSQKISVQKHARISESFKKLKEFYPEYYNYLSNDTSLIYKFSKQVVVSPQSIFYHTGLRYDLISTINSWVGVPYRSAGRGKGGVDCSNFVSCITEEATGISIPAGSASQATLFKPIYSIDSLQFGDLIFFTGRNKKSKRIGHVGYYIGNGLFAHSSSNKGVIYTHISEGYYNERYRFGGRFDNRLWTVDPEKKSRNIFITEIPE